MRPRSAFAVGCATVLVLSSCGKGGEARRVAFASEGDRCKDAAVLYLDDHDGDELRCDQATYRGPLTGAQKNAVFELAHRLALDGGLSKADKQKIRDFAASPTSVERTVRPDAIAVGEDAVWVLGDDRLVRIDPTAGTAELQPVSLKDATELAVGEGAVWVLAAGEVVKVDPRTGERLGSVPVYEDAFLGDPRTVGLTTGLGAVWVAWHTGQGPVQVTRLDPAGLRRTAQVQISPNGQDVSRHLLVAGGQLWTAPSGYAYLARFDPVRQRIAGGVGLSDLTGSHGTVAAVAASADALWVLVGPVGDGLLRVDLRTGKAVEVLSSKQLPQKNGFAQYAQGVAVVGSTPWLAVDQTLVEVDVARHRLLRTVALGNAAERQENVSAVTSGLGALWVMANEAVVKVDPVTGSVVSVPLPSQAVAVR